MPRNAFARHSIVTQWPASAPLHTPWSLAVRFASTSPRPPSHAPPVHPPSTTDYGHDPNLDTIVLGDVDLDLPANIPEHIGYLREIGIDFGWGPTSMLQFVVEHIHIYAGIPWWASIITLAVGVRVALFPLYLKASESAARSTAMARVAEPIQARMKETRRTGDTTAFMAAYQEYRMVKHVSGVKLRHQFLPIGIQTVVGFCGYRLFSTMATLPVPALTTDGFLWFTDMTKSDPYLIVPAMMALSLHILARNGGEMGSSSLAPPLLIHFMKWGIPALLLLVSGYQPGLVCIWFAIGSILSTIQTLTLRRPAVRRFFNLTQFYKKPSAQKASFKDRPFISRSASSAESPIYQAPTHPSRGSGPRQGQVIDVAPVSRAASSQVPRSGLGTGRHARKKMGGKGS